MLNYLLLPALTTFAFVLCSLTLTRAADECFAEYSKTNICDFAQKVQQEMAPLLPMQISSNLVVRNIVSVGASNDYAKLGFKPSVTVKIDTNNWVINNIITELDTIKLVEIKNTYKKVDNNYIMPSASTVQYFIKDAKLSGWLKKDITSIVGKNPLEKSNDMVEGKISIIYEDYIINKGIKDKIFD